MKPHPLLLSTLGLGLLPYSDSRAQEALIGAIETDQVLQFRAQPPAGKLLGPLNWSVLGTFGAEWNDNFRQRSTDRLSDFILRPGVDLSLAWPISQRAVLSFGAGVQYAAYVEYDEYNSLDMSPDSAISLSFDAGDVAVTVFNRVSYTDEVLSDPELTGLARYPRLDNQAGVRATWTLADWQLQGGATHVNFWPFDDDYSYLERSSQQFFLRGAYLIGPGTRAGLEGSVSLTDYREDVRRDVNSYSAGPFAEWNVIEGLQVTARGGAVRAELRENPLNPGSNTVDSYYAGGSIDHQLTDFIRHTASAQHDLRVGLNAELTENTTFRYTIRWQMTDVWNVSAGARYELGERPNNVSFQDVDETSFDRYSVDAGIGRQITNRLTARAGYRYTRRESSSDRNYYQNIVSLSLSYRL